MIWLCMDVCKIRENSKSGQLRRSLLSIILQASNQKVRIESRLVVGALFGCVRTGPTQHLTSAGYHAEVLLAPTLSAWLSQGALHRCQVPQLLQSLGILDLGLFLLFGLTPLRLFGSRWRVLPRWRHPLLLILRMLEGTAIAMLALPLEKEAANVLLGALHDIIILGPPPSIQQVLMQASRKKELQFEYRDYLESGQAIPAGTYIGQYKVGREIGKGAFGKIYLALDKQGKEYAIKLMDLEKISREANPKIQEIRQRLVQNQPTLMQQCDSPNVLRCYQIFENECLKVLVLQYCNGHTLQEYLDRKIRIKQEEAVRILRQVINGIAELHRHSIIHRDLKADNIMEHEGQYKIIDLGFSKKLDIANEQAQVKGTILGTVTTMAPEVLSKQSYGLKADIWSLGVIFFQMVFGVMLYDSVSARQRLKEIEEKRYFSPDKELTFNGITVSADANNFLYRALEVSTEKRMGWRELLEHPLIRQKEEEPIGDRFLVQNNLKLPEVNLDIQLEPTARFVVNNQKPIYPGKNEVVDHMQDDKGKKPVVDKPEPKKEPRNNEFKIKIQHQQPKWPKQSERQLAEWRFRRQRPIEDMKPPAQPPMRQQDSPDFKWVKQAHLQCLKTELIYHQLILPIQRLKILDLEDRQVVEFMFLIAARCFQNVSPISVRVQSEQARVNPIVKNLHSQVKSLYQKVYEKFQAYSQQLTKLENSFAQMFLDFFRKRFLKKNYQEKSSFTSGIEVPEEEQEKKKAERYGDYSKVEQINYTYANYVNNILKKITQNKRLDPMTMEKVSGYLRYYDRICLVNLEELDRETFEEYVRRIIL